MEDDMVTDETSGDMSVNIGNDELKDQPGAQEHVGLKRKESLLKQLIADRTESTQQTGVNDQILAKSLHKEKAPKADATQNNTSPVSKPKHKINPRGK
jgi:hypothetical protein